MLAVWYKKILVESETALKVILVFTTNKGFAGQWEEQMKPSFLWVCASQLDSPVSSKAQAPFKMFLVVVVVFVFCFSFQIFRQFSSHGVSSTEACWMGCAKEVFFFWKQCLFTKILAFYFWQPFFTEFGRQVQKLQVQSNKQIPTTVGTNRCIYMYTYADNVTLVIWKINLGYLPVLCQTFTCAWSEPGELQYISVLWLNSSLLAHAANMKQLKIHVGLWILPLAHPFEWCPTFVVFLYRGGLQKSLLSVTMSLGSSARRKPEKC